MPENPQIDAVAQAADDRARYVDRIETWARWSTVPVVCNACGRRLHGVTATDPECACPKPSVTSVDQQIRDLRRALDETTATLATVRAENETLASAVDAVTAHAADVRSVAASLIAAIDATTPGKVPAPRPEEFAALIATGDPA